MKTVEQIWSEANAEIVEALVEALGTTRIELLENRKPEQIKALIKFRLADLSQPSER